MTQVAEQIVVEWQAQTRHFETGMKRVRNDLKATRGQVNAANDNLKKHDRQLKRSAENWKKFSTRAKTAAAAVGVALAAMVGKFAQNTSTAQDSIAQLNATIASTGGVAGKSTEALVAYSGELQKVTRYGDEAIQASQGLLLTFTQIRGDTFDRTTRAILDMSTAMKRDLKESTLQVGKALNDPIKGVGALAESGIQFTDSQKDMIKSLVETGQVAQAQALILEELERQFGGSAEAARNTLGGALVAVKNAFNDLFEMSGPGAERLRQSIEGLVTTISSDSFKNSFAAFGEFLASAINVGAQAFDLLVKLIQGAYAEMVYLGKGTAAMFVEMRERVGWVAETIGERFGIAAERAGAAFSILYNTAKLWFEKMILAAQNAGIGIKNAILAGLQGLFDGGVLGSLGEGLESIGMANPFAGIANSLEGLKSEFKSTSDGVNEAEAALAAARDRMAEAQNRMDELNASFEPSANLQAWQSAVQDAAAEVVRTQEATKEAARRLFSPDPEVAPNSALAVTPTTPGTPVTPATSGPSAEAAKAAEKAAEKLREEALERARNINEMTREMAQRNALVQALNSGGIPAYEQVIQEQEALNMVRSAGIEPAHAEYQNALQIARAHVQQGVALDELKGKMEQTKAASKTFSEAWSENITQMQSMGEQLADTLHNSMGQFFDGFIDDVMTGKKSFGEMTKSILFDLGKMIMKMMLMRAVSSMFGMMGFSDGGASSGGGEGFLPFAKGGVKRYGQGGVVNRPQMFNNAGSMAKISELGPEAIMPLTKTGKGELGVKAVGMGGGENTTIINNINVQAPPGGKEEDAYRFAEVIERSLEQKIVQTMTRNQKRMGGRRGGLVA